MERGGAIYIMTNKNKTTLYVGVTSNLVKRIYEHKNHIYKKAFTSKYNLTEFVYYESFHSIEEAIIREKQLKSGSRKKKEDLINKQNPEWNDLYNEVLNW